MRAGEDQWCQEKRCEESCDVHFDLENGGRSSEAELVLSNFPRCSCPLYIPLFPFSHTVLKSTSASDIAFSSLCQVELVH